MTEIIEKLEHGIMICSATGTMLVHIDKGDAEKVVALLKEQKAVEPTWSRGKPFCGACGLRIHGGKFCSECGRPVLWKGR